MMRLAAAESRAYTYKLTAPNAEKPITLAELKSWLGITHNLSDSALTIIISAVTAYAENYTNRTIMRATFVTRRDFFPGAGTNEGFYPYGILPVFGAGINENIGFEIRKSPLVSVSSIVYTDGNGILQTVANSNYYLTQEEDYSSVLKTPDGQWPIDSANKLDSVAITFIAGLFATAITVDAEWKHALLVHATAMWANRGDCSNSACAGAIPGSAQAFYDNKRIMNL